MIFRLQVGDASHEDNPIISYDIQLMFHHPVCGAEVYLQIVFMMQESLHEAL